MPGKWGGARRVRPPPRSANVNRFAKWQSWGRSRCRSHPFPHMHLCGHRFLEKKIDMISLVFFRLSINSVAFLAKTFPQSTTSQCCRSLNKVSHCHTLVEGKGNLDYQGNFSHSNIFVIVVNAKKTTISWKQMELAFTSLEINFIAFNWQGLFNFFSGFPLFWTDKIPWYFQVF